MTSSVGDLLFVSCISRLDVARDCLLASPCLQPGGRPLKMHWNAHSAAQALNSVLDAHPPQRWVVWVHQDVRLPLGWDTAFLAAIERAQNQWDTLAVVGVYGVAGAGAQARRAGHVLDRGHLLYEPQALPCVVDSLDELLFAVRGDTRLRLDPALGFDFYATDLVLQAQEAGLTSIVVDSCCEHWSDTPVEGLVPASLARRIAASGALFEEKWKHRLPVSTPCFNICQPGDVQACADALARV
ncbi:MAG: hypothetical protein HUU13_00280 [Burkholderiaceae bacterium]|nr:hypothetical protein [Burkholderiaceae bacterium]